MVRQKVHGVVSLIRGLDLEVRKGVIEDIHENAGQLIRSDKLLKEAVTGGRASRIKIKRALDLFGAWKADPMVCIRID